MCEVERAYNFLLARGKSVVALDDVLQSDTPEELIWWADDVIDDEVEAEALLLLEQQITDAGY